MKKRPLSIIIISMVYFFWPAGNLVQAAFLNNLPFFGESGVLSRFLWSDWIISCLFPLVAIGIYRVRRWGWYIFISFSVLLIGYNLFLYFFLTPNYSLDTLIFFIIIITGISAFFLRKHVYAPYFNPGLRWWETADRYRVSMDTVIMTYNGAGECHTLDISETGCFIDCRRRLTVGSLVWLKIHCRGIEINCPGKVVRKSGPKEHIPGYGIMFQNMPKETRKWIKHLIWSLERLGYGDRKEVIPISEIPNDFLEKGYNAFNQMGFRAKNSLSLLSQMCATNRFIKEGKAL